MTRAYRLKYPDGSATDIPEEIFSGYKTDFATFRSFNGFERLDKITASMNNGGEILLRVGKNLFRPIKVPKGTSLERLD